MKAMTLSLFTRCALLVILLVYGYARAGEINANSITGAKMDRAGEQFTITVHVYPDAQKLREARGSIIRGAPPVTDNGNPRENSDADGFSVINHTKGTCDIYVVRVKNERDREGMRLWGHELAHCIYGTYHQ